MCQSREHLGQDLEYKEAADSRRGNSSVQRSEEPRRAEKSRTAASPNSRGGNLG